MAARCYPIFVSLERRVCLVVGGGAVGERKIRKLLEYGASVRLVARDLTPWLEERSREGAILWTGEKYDTSRLDGVFLVFAATSDPDLNSTIAAEARSRGILCNMATDPEEGSFIVPAVFRQGPLTIAIGTEGLSPALSKRIRERLEHEFGPEWARYISLLGLLRAAVKAKELGTTENQRIFRDLVALPLVEWIKGEYREPALEAINGICHPWLTREELSEIWKEAWKLSSYRSPCCVTSLE